MSCPFNRSLDVIYLYTKISSSWLLPYIKLPLKRQNILELGDKPINSSTKSKNIKYMNEN